MCCYDNYPLDFKQTLQCKSDYFLSNNKTAKRRCACGLQLIARAVGQESVRPQVAVGPSEQKGARLVKVTSKP